MAETALHQIIDRWLLIIVVATLTAAVSFFELTHPAAGRASDFGALAAGTRNAAAPEVKKASTQSALSSPKPAATPAPVAASTPTAASSKATALTTSLVHLRSAKSVNSTILAQIAGGTTVQLRDDADATWQGVVYQGKIGYIFRDYLQY